VHSLRLLVAAALPAAIAIGLSASTPARAPLATEPIVDLTAEVTLLRLPQDPQTVGVLVTNHGTEPVWVREVELVTESFAPTGPVEKRVMIRAGAAKALTVGTGEARCGGGTAPPLARTTARLVVAADAAEPTDDQWQAVELQVAAADVRLVSRLHADCAGQLVAAAADVRLERWSALPDGRLRGMLVVERRTGDQPLTVHDLNGSTLYTLTTDPRDGELGRLPPGEARLDIPVVAGPAQCSAHALADSKAPYGFRIWVTVGDSAKLSAGVATDQAGRAEFRQMWQVRCGQ
jgi:hypothetical protein